MSKEREALKLALYVIEAWDRDCEHSDYWRDRKNAIDAIREALAEQPAQQQEPVAVYVGETWCGSVVSLYEDLPLETPLYTSPPASKPWVELTDEEAAVMMMEAWGCASIAPRHAPAFARAIEAKLKEKNT